jgi:non-ribosomal peptide synthetase component F
MVLLAAIKLALHQDNKRDDLSIAITLAGQPLSGHFTLVGPCSTVLPIRSVISSKGNVHSALSNTRSKMLKALEHHEFSYSDLLKALMPDNPDGAINLCRCSFTHVKRMATNQLDFAGVIVEYGFVTPRAQLFELYLVATEYEDSVEIE